MKLSQVAVTIYTIRDHLKTLADIAASMRKLKDMGFEAIQVSGVGDTDYNELGKIITDAGLTCCATHEKTTMILDEPATVVKRLSTLNCRYTALPHPGSIDLSTVAAVKAFAGRINQAGKVLRDAGQVLTYHNHGTELRKVGGSTILEVIYGETDPQLLQGEIDTHWVQNGGGDPVGWCRRLEGRLPLLHMKDYGVSAESKPVFAEIGYGNLNWPAIIDAADSAGCEWFIIEQDAAWANNDPFESVRLSFEYIKNNLCS